MKMINSWRIFGFGTVIAQILRFPLLLLIVQDKQALNSFFIASSLLLPVYFISNEFIAFRTNDLPLRVRDKAICLSIALFNFIFAAALSDLIVFILFALLAISSIINAELIQLWRKKWSAEFQIKQEFFLNAAQTIAIVALCVRPLFFSNISLGIGIVLFLCSLACGLYTFLWLGACRGEFQNLLNLKRILKETSSEVASGRAGERIVYRSMSVPLFLLAAVQIERYALSVIDPQLIAFVVIAASILMAARKLLINESILFEKIASESVCSFGNLFTIGFSQAFRWFASISLIFSGALIASAAFPGWILDALASFDPQNFGYSLDKVYHYYYFIISVIVIYTLTTPFSIYLYANCRARIGYTIPATLWFILLIYGALVWYFAFTTLIFSIMPIAFILVSCLLEILIFSFLFISLRLRT